MGLSIKPLACHGGCLGCYEKEVRDSGQFPAFDIQKVLSTLRDQMALDKENKWNHPTLHGGEPLMLPLPGIATLLAAVYEKYGKSGIQTSGIGITPAHIELFALYKTSIGVSIDGDRAATNWGRWNNPCFDAAEMTDKTLANIRAMTDAGISVSTITVLRKCNAGTPALRTDLIRFAMKLKDEYKVNSSRFNAFIAFEERAARDEELPTEDLAAVYRVLLIKAIAEDLAWYPMLDFAKGLRGESTECVFGECDPWATESEITILGDGSLGVCMKRDGVIQRTDKKSRARYEALPQVPQSAGGCKGCFWWPYCKGGCPGAGLNGDWRNRTRFCEAYKRTWELVSSLSLFPPKETCGAQGIGGHGDREHGDSNDPAWRAKHPEWKGTVTK